MEAQAKELEILREEIRSTENILKELHKQSKELSDEIHHGFFSAKEKDVLEKKLAGIHHACEDKKERLSTLQRILEKKQHR